MCNFTNYSQSSISRSRIICTNLPKYNPLPVLQKGIISGGDFITFLGLLLAAAVAIFAVLSRALLGFWVHFCLFFDTLNPFLPRIVNKSPSPSA